MKLEDKVAAIEQSKKLIELGFKMKTGKYWVKMLGDSEWILSTKHPDKHVYYDQYIEFISPIEIHIPAPDVAELGEALPWKIIIDRRECHLDICKNKEGDINVVSYINRGHSMMYSAAAETEAQARAEALIWLIKNKYVEV